MIIKLRKYIKVRELLIGTNITELLGHIFYWDIEMEGVCIYGNCPHGEDRDGAKNMTQVHTVSC